MALKYQTNENRLVYTVNGRPRIVNKFKVTFSRSVRSLEKKGYVILVYADEYNRNKVKSVFLTEKGWRCRVKNWGKPKRRHKTWSDDTIEQLLIDNDIGLSRELYEKAKIVVNYAPDDVKTDFSSGKLSINRAWQLTLVHLYLKGSENED